MHFLNSTVLINAYQEIRETVSFIWVCKLTWETHKTIYPQSTNQFSTISQEKNIYITCYTYVNKSILIKSIIFIKKLSVLYIVITQIITLTIPSVSAFTMSRKGHCVFLTGNTGFQSSFLSEMLSS